MGPVHFVFHLCSAIRFVRHLCSNIHVVYTYMCIVYRLLSCDWLYIADMHFPSDVQFTSVIVIIIIELVIGKVFCFDLRYMYMYKLKIMSFDYRDCVWGVLTGICNDIPPLVRHDVRQIETWILRFLSAPVPVPGKTRVEIELLDTQPPMAFALPDHTRFSLADFPLHLPLELLGVDTCLKVLTLIMLENKVITFCMCVH